MQRMHLMKANFEAQFQRQADWQVCPCWQLPGSGAPGPPALLVMTSGFCTLPAGSSCPSWPQSVACAPCCLHGYDTINHQEQQTCAPSALASCCMLCPPECVLRCCRSRQRSVPR